MCAATPKAVLAVSPKCSGARNAKIESCSICLQVDVAVEDLNGLTVRSSHDIAGIADPCCCGEDGRVVQRSGARAPQQGVPGKGSPPGRELFITASYSWGMVDEELSAALAAYRDALEQYRKEPPHKPGAIPTPDERFLADFGTERGQTFLPTIHALHAEARRVPDPGGPLGNYSDALVAWAKTHPEVDLQVLNRVIRELLWAAK